MKKKIKFQYKETINMEKTILRWLAVISSISLISTIFIEFILNKDTTANNHIVYIENVLLAVSGSSIISFICMIIPHRRKIEDEKNKLYNSLKCIYVEYSKLITFINNNITQEDYKYEPFIIKSNRETNKKTEELITQLNNEYDLSCIESSDIKNIINILNKKICYNLYIMDKFFSTVLLFETKNIETEDSKAKDENDNIQAYNAKSKIEFNETYYRAKKEYYTYILKETEDIYSYKDFSNLFKSIFKLFSVTNEKLINDIYNLQTMIEQTMLINQKLAKGIYTSHKISEIHSKYWKEYWTEEIEIRSTIEKIFRDNFDMNEDNIKKLYESFNNQALEMVKQNKTKEAKKMIEKFKKDNNIK